MSSYHVSLKGHIKAMELLDIIDGVQKGKKKAIKKLNEYAEKGSIRPELYNKIMADCGKKKKKVNYKKPVCIILCIVLLLSLVSVAVVYHNNAIDKAYAEGANIGYAEGKDIGYDKGYAFYEKIKDEYEFFHEYAVITTKAGEKYHRYDCYHIRNRSFYIFTKSSAESRGYTPCRDCFPTFEDILNKYSNTSAKINKKYGIQQ